jgi:hypothetical protein
VPAGFLRGHHDLWMTKVFGRLSKAADNAKRRENFSAFARCAAIALKNRKLLDQDSNLEQTG